MKVTAQGSSLNEASVQESPSISRALPAFLWVNSFCPCVSCVCLFVCVCRHEKMRDMVIATLCTQAQTCSLGTPTVSVTLNWWHLVDLTHTYTHLLCFALSLHTHRKTARWADWLLLPHTHTRLTDCSSYFYVNWFFAFVSSPPCLVRGSGYCGHTGIPNPRAECRSRHHAMMNEGVE